MTQKCLKVTVSIFSVSLSLDLATLRQFPRHILPTHSLPVCSSSLSPFFFFFFFDGPPFLVCVVDPCVERWNDQNQHYIHNSSLHYSRPRTWRSSHEGILVDAPTFTGARPIGMMMASHPRSLGRMRSSPRRILSLHPITESSDEAALHIIVSARFCLEKKIRPFINL